MKRLFAAVDRRASQLTPRRAFWLLVGTNMLILALVLVAIVLPRAGAFSVDARTEVLAVRMEAGAPLPALGKARVIGAPGCADFSFYQPIEGPVEVEAVRRGETRWLLVRAIGAPRRPIGSYLCAGVEAEVLGSVMLDPFSGPGAVRTLVLEGAATLGELPGGGADASLLSGTVRASAWSLPFRSARAVEVSELMTGDELRLFPDPSADRQASAVTLVRLDDEQQAFHVVVQGVAAIAEVKRLGVDASTPIVRAPSIWSRFQAQSEWPVLLLAAALLLNLAAGVRHYSEASRP